VIFAGSFGWFIGDAAPAHLPGAPFYLAGLLLLAAVAVAWRFAPRAPAAAGTQPA
jgi:DHA1 family tetracycline resistance protein-like MFS transporter